MSQISPPLTARTGSMATEIKAMIAIADEIAEMRHTTAAPPPAGVEPEEWEQLRRQLALLAPQQSRAS